MGGTNSAGRVGCLLPAMIYALMEGEGGGLCLL